MPWKPIAPSSCSVISRGSSRTSLTASDAEPKPGGYCRSRPRDLGEHSAVANDPAFLPAHQLLDPMDLARLDVEGIGDRAFDRAEVRARDLDPVRDVDAMPGADLVQRRLGHDRPRETVGVGPMELEMRREFLGMVADELDIFVGSRNKDRFCPRSLELLFQISEQLRVGRQRGTVLQIARCTATLRHRRNFEDLDAVASEFPDHMKTRRGSAENDGGQFFLPTVCVARAHS
jgi:hypothetical protein